MKTLAVLLLVMIIWTPFTNSQVYVGPLAGAQISWTKFNDNDVYDIYKIKPVWGFHAGANISLKARNRFFLHTSFLYSTKGRSVESKQDPLLTNKVKYKFVEVPIVYAVDFRARLGGGRNFNITLE